MNNYIYIITTPAYAKMGQYKIGYHTGTKDDLWARYGTPMPELQYEMFEPCANHKIVESAIKRELKAVRVKNINGNLSEFYEMPIETLKARVTKLIVEFRDAEPPSVMDTKNYLNGAGCFPPAMVGMEITTRTLLDFERQYNDAYFGTDDNVMTAILNKSLQFINSTQLSAATPQPTRHVLVDTFDEWLRFTSIEKIVITNKTRMHGYLKFARRAWHKFSDDVDCTNAENLIWFLSNHSAVDEGELYFYYNWDAILPDMLKKCYNKKPAIHELGRNEFIGYDRERDVDVIINMSTLTSREISADEVLVAADHVPCLRGLGAGANPIVDELLCLILPRLTADNFKKIARRLVDADNTHQSIPIIVEDSFAVMRALKILLGFANARRYDDISEGNIPPKRKATKCAFIEGRMPRNVTNDDVVKKLLKIGYENIIFTPRCTRLPDAGTKFIITHAVEFQAIVGASFNMFSTDMFHEVRESMFIPILHWLLG